PKKGRRSGKNQAREGDKAHRTGRWPGHSSGSATHERFAGRGHASGNDAGASEGGPLRAGPASPEAETHHRRPRLRLQPAARTVATPGHRTAGSASPQPGTLVATGWTQAAALPPTLENRAHLRLAAKLPPHRSASRPHPCCLSRLFPSGVLDDHLEVFMKPAVICSKAQVRTSSGFLKQ